MTGYTVHTGPSGKFSEGWQRIFGAPTGKAKAKSKDATSSKAKSKTKSSKSGKRAR